MLFLIGIIERNSGQLCTVKSNILSKNSEFERRTISDNMDLHLLFIHFSFKLLKFLN